MTSIRHGLTLALATAALLLTAGAASATTITWNVDADGSWADAANWDLGRIPQAGDDVVIDRPGADITVDWVGTSVSIRSLTCAETLRLQTGTKQFDADSVISGKLLFEQGRLAGPGKLTVSGEVEFTTLNTKGLDGITFEITGTAIVTGGGSLQQIGNPASIVNAAGGTFDIRTDVAIAGLDFENLGTFTKSGGSGSARMPVLNNHGTVHLAEGTLEIRGGTSSSTGAFTSDAGTVLAFGPYVAHSFSATSSISAGGDVLFSTGTYQVDGAFSAAGDTRLFQATVTFTQDASTGTLEMDGYSLITEADLDVTGRMTWLRGDLIGPGRILAGGGIELTTTLGKGLREGMVVECSGNSLWSGGKIDHHGPGTSSIVNHAGNTFEVTGDNVWAGPSTFVNHGIYLRSSGSGVNRLPPVESDGRVEVRTGTLRIDIRSTNSGPYELEAGTVLELRSGSHDFSATAPLTAGGDVHLNSATTNFQGAYSVDGNTKVFQATATLPDGATTGSLEMLGYTLNLAGDVEVTGRTTWTAGGIHGPGRLLARDGVHLTTAGQKVFVDGATIECFADSLWDGGRILGKTGSSIVNHAGLTFEATGDNHWDHGGGGTTLVNHGTYLRSSGSGENRLHTVENHGIVDLQTGSLRIGSGSTNTNSVVTSSGTVLELIGTHDYSSASTLNVGGDLFFNSAIATIEGAFDVAGDTHQFTGAVTLSAGGTTGTLNMDGYSMELGANLEVAGRVTWARGTFRGPGHLMARSGIDIVVAANQKGLQQGIVIQLFDDSTWSGGDINGREGSAIVNHADLDFTATGDFRWVHHVGGSTLVNHGNYIRASGTGVNRLATVENDGEIVVQTGTLRIGGGSTHTGPVTLAGGTTLELSGTGSTHSFSPFAPLEAAGDVYLNAVNSRFEGLYQVAGETHQYVGGSEFVQGGTTGTLKMDGYQLNTGGDFEVAGRTTWMRGQFRGPGRILARGGMDVVASGQLLGLNKAVTVENFGHSYWDGGDLNGLDGSLFLNHVGATMEVRTDLVWKYNSGGSTIRNEGDWLRTQGTGTASYSCIFENPGSLEVKSGTLHSAYGFTTSGSVLVDSGATLSRNGDYAQTAGLTQLDGGTLTATGTVDIQGGSLEGVGTVDADLANAGAVRPGGSSATGTLTVTGDYSGAGSVEIEMESAADFDVLSIGGAASFDTGSKLDLVLLSGFVPATTDVFLVMPYASYSGAFGTVNGAVINAVKTFLLDYDGSGGLTLTIDGDDTPPVFGPVTVDPDRLWPPDHELVEVTVTVEVSDDSGEAVTLSATVESDEPDNGLGDGDTDNDIGEVSIDQEAGTITVDLRAERAAQGDGRTYTITITATDTSGNSATTTVEVFVPHDEND